MEQIINEIKKYIPEEEIALNEQMKKHTTFRVGGDAEEVKKIIEVCNELEVPYHVVGNGSNLLVSDQGLNGVVISVRKNAEYIKLNGDVIIAGAGSSLAKVANFAAKEGLGGLEFAAGIPGTIGGAIVMNAGAFGGEIKDVLVSAKVCTKEGKILEIEAQDLELSYRHSCVLEKEYIVLEATFKLKEADKEEIFAAMDDYKRRRISSQPLNFPSAGSTFKRPKDNFAGKLIEDSGLKGYKIGGAQVSEKHCGFVVNSNAATATDVYELINYVISVVKTKYDVTLEPEVKMMGEF